MALCHQDIPEVVDYILVSPIPPVLKHTMRRILEDGLQTEGIFRVPGNRYVESRNITPRSYYGRNALCSSSTNIVKLKERFDAGITVDLKVSTCLTTFICTKELGRECLSSFLRILANFMYIVDQERSYRGCCGNSKAILP